MAQRLFSVGKVGVFLDAVALGKEKRVGGAETTVLKLTCRIDPFTPELASAIDDGLGGDTNVRASVFRLSDGSPKPHLERLDMSLDCPRQRVDLYASPDTDSSRICFDQVKVSGFYVRAQKDSAALSAVVTLSFGPFGRDEMEACAQYFRAQFFASFHEAEPTLAFDEDAGGDDAGSPPTPMWEPVPPDEESLADREKRSRPTAKRGTRSKRAKHDPEAERVEQVAAGKAKKPNGAVHA